MQKDDVASAKAFEMVLYQRVSQNLKEISSTWFFLISDFFFIYPVRWKIAVYYENALSGNHVGLE